MQIAPVNLEGLFSAVPKVSAPVVAEPGDFSRSLQEQETIRARSEDAKPDPAPRRKETRSVEPRREKEAASENTSEKKRPAQADRSQRRDEPEPTAAREVAQNREEVKTLPPEENPDSAAEKAAVADSAELGAGAAVVAAQPPTPGAAAVTAEDTGLDATAQSVELSAAAVQPDFASPLTPEVLPAEDGARAEVAAPMVVAAPVEVAATLGEPALIVPAEVAEGEVASATEAGPLSPAPLAAGAGTPTMAIPMVDSAGVSAVPSADVQLPPAVTGLSAAHASAAPGEAERPVEGAGPLPKEAATPAVAVQRLTELLDERKVAAAAVEVRAAQPRVAEPQGLPLAAAPAAAGSPQAPQAAVVAQLAQSLTVPGAVSMVPGETSGVLAGSAKKPTIVPGEGLGKASEQRFAQLFGGREFPLRGQPLREVAVAGADDAAVVLDSRPAALDALWGAGDADGVKAMADGVSPEISAGLSNAAMNGSSLSALAGITQPAPHQTTVVGVPVQPSTAGLPIPEEKILEQVIGKLTVNRGERQSSITLNLNPEELGRVRLELTVEEDRVRAQLHAQSQQVQDILEKHLPKLREALEQQGLKLEDVRVSSDASQQGGKGFYQEQRPPTPSRFASRMHAPAAAEVEPAVVVASRPALRQGGISVRV